MAKTKTIVIGDVARWKAQGRNFSSTDELSYVSIDALCAETIAKISPDTILSPLVADTFDALDVAETLHQIGFQGQYCVVADPLPNKKAIIAEVNAKAPGLRFDILTMPLN
ncbi:hypothetical protein [Loktanella sp. S4079]|uniref:hypothetical protein n=1 Tax=Loktanella sp. S4079 TaxID=579483 RepID=UPI0005FA753E|nr:hypothetical protein [Loktanella sp. S4079]KJZ20144.1 hypothetical protein TW80_04725 [Loktanella sp. S4079]